MTKLVEGKPTRSGKTTYLYRNKKGEVVSLLPDSAEERGYEPILSENDVENEVNIANSNKKSKKENPKKDKKKPKKPLFKGAAQLFREFYENHQEFEIYLGAEKIFDTAATSKTKLTCLRRGIKFFDKEYSYDGLRLKAKS
jgi:hypothetical protein